MRQKGIERVPRLQFIQLRSLPNYHIAGSQNMRTYEDYSERSGNASLAHCFSCLPALRNIGPHYMLCLIVNFGPTAPVGICYGNIADNHPPPSSIVSLLQSNAIPTVRIFKPSPEVLQSFSDSGINLMIGVPNEILPSLANNPVTFSLQWLQSNILDYFPPTHIKYLAVGNEVFFKDPYYTPFVVPSIWNLHQALKTLNLDQMIKLSTPHAACVLGTSFPPSNGSFNNEIMQQMIPLLQFLQQNDSPFMVNIYPFFSYINNKKDIGLDYALFNSQGYMLDNELYYNNLFDATLDSFVAAMEREGFPGVRIVVTETGWPTGGGEDASPDNARMYNGNVVRRARGDVGTPMRPGVGVEVFLFDMFDENEKDGQEYEKHFGVFELNVERNVIPCGTIQPARGSTNQARNTNVAEAVEIPQVVPNLNENPPVPPTETEPPPPDTNKRGRDETDTATTATTRSKRRQSDQ
uniref:Glucan endo-1,3-beta-D-glucosidase n=1 Tax=Chenopodium quinoa TaxID=63459 RepID=A0A803LJA4_CHEQI